MHPNIHPKIIVIDDDPTGSQTVHSCLLLLRWDVATLREALRDAAPIFFILANTRSMTVDGAIATVRDICRNLKTALALEQIEHYLLVSRSDSTLRGHFPAETEAIAAEFGEFDACFHTPAFFEGGRITRDGTHYIVEGERLIPVHETEFAQDAVFGFNHSFLPDYIAEKTQGAIAAQSVQMIQPRQLDTNFEQYLLNLRHNQQVVINAETQADFDRITPALWQAIAQGKKFLFRSAASLLTSLADLGSQPSPAAEMGSYRPTDKPGVMFIGSHVCKTTEQLTYLLQSPGVQGIEIDVQQCQDPGDRLTLTTTIAAQIQQIFAQNLTPVIYTSRTFIPQPNPRQQLHYGENITAFFLALLPHLPTEISYLVSKGGNTSNQLLSEGLQLPKISLLGQIMAGCCLVRTEATHPLFPNLPIILFPGNVGDRQTLQTLHQRLQFPPLRSR